MADQILVYPSDVTNALKRADVNRDGKISYNELKELKDGTDAERIAYEGVANNSKAGWKSNFRFQGEDVAGYAREDMAMGKAVELAQEYLRKMDQNKSGSISQSEMDYFGEHYYSRGTYKYDQFMKNNGDRYK
jgi:Ca2+-binding EF-hand superfamily protein